MARAFTNWTLRRAARLGYLAGRGLPLDAIAADAQRSQHSIRHVMSRWHVPSGGPGGMLSGLEDRSELERAALRRGVSADTIALRLLRVISSDQLIDAILDDGERR